MRLILAIPFLLFTALSSPIIFTHAADPNFCPTSTCGDLSIAYPFKLPNTPQTSDGCSYLDLRCNEPRGNGTSATVISLPHGGDFYVRNISYDYPYVQLYDPGGCLAGRLISDAFSLDSTPFKAAVGDAFTFYTCPASAELGDGFYTIECLSNTTNATVATDFVPPQGLGCDEIGRWGLPVLFNGVNEDLYLTWDATSCQACAGDAGDAGNSLESPYFSTTLVVIALAVATCSCFVTRKIVGRPNAAAAGQHGLPVSSIAMAALPPRPVCRGLEESKIDSYTKVMVLGEGIVDSGSDANTCPICLERFEAQEVVRSIVGCEHCFHGECIVTWLIKSRSCPVCRIILSET